LIAISLAVHTEACRVRIAPIGKLVEVQGPPAIRLAFRRAFRRVPLPPGVVPTTGPIRAFDPHVAFRVDGDVSHILLVGFTPVRDAGVIYIVHEAVGCVPRPSVRVIVLLTLVDAGVHYGLYEGVGVSVDGYVAF
jgi:hypothetical protein